MIVLPPIEVTLGQIISKTYIDSEFYQCQGHSVIISGFAGPTGTIGNSGYTYISFSGATVTIDA